MASSMVTPSPFPQPPRPNLSFRRLRGQRSPAEFAAAVRRSAREIGERVSCDARYVGRVEAGEIRCPNYAYERVFLHMFPGRTLADLGFAPRSSVRGRGARTAEDAPPHTSQARPSPWMSRPGRVRRRRCTSRMTRRTRTTRTRTHRTTRRATCCVAHS